MAQWELDYGSDAQLLNISQSIITSQTSEVQKMKKYLTLIPGCASDSAPSSDMVSQFYHTCSMQARCRLIRNICHISLLGCIVVPCIDNSERFCLYAFA